MEAFKKIGANEESRGFHAFGSAMADQESYWTNSAVDCVLTYDRALKVFRTESSKSVLKCLYGPLAPVRGLRSRISNGFKALSLIEVIPNFRIPRDAVIFSPPSADRLVVVSKFSGRTMKLFGGYSVDGPIHEEISNLSLIEGLGLGAHIPRIVGSGNLKGDVQWMVTEFADNSNPVDILIRKDFFYRRWIKWKQKNLIPFLISLHKASEPEFVDATNVTCAFREAWCKTNVLDADDLLAYPIDQLNTLSRVPTSLIYGDVVSKHVHRDRSGHWKIVDWGKSRRGPIMTDYLADYFGCPGGKTARDQDFAHWMRGEKPLKHLSRAVRMDVEIAYESYSQIVPEVISIDLFVGSVQLACLVEATRLLGRDEIKAATQFLYQWVSPTS